MPSSTLRPACACRCRCSCSRRRRSLRIRPLRRRHTATSGTTPAQALRLVSILFLDIVGSTALGQGLDPQEIHAVMDGALQRLTAVVQAHGGRVLQIAGDHLLAGFGTREVHEDDAERAVRCGRALLAEGRRKHGGLAGPA